MPLSYESIGMPMRGSNISQPLKSQEKETKKVKGANSLKEYKEFTAKEKSNDKKRKNETRDDGLLDNKRKRFVIGPGGQTKTLDVSTFHREHEVAKSKRKKEKKKK